MIQYKISKILDWDEMFSIHTKYKPPTALKVYYIMILLMYINDSNINILHTY